jgi:cysteinyl-tRNA synthetase
MASIKTLRDNLNTFNANLLLKAEDFFGKMMVLIHHSNKDVKEESQELFEKFIESLAEKLDDDVNTHKVSHSLFILRKYSTS